MGPLTVERFVIDWVSAVLFVVVFSVLLTLYDRYRPVYDYRVRAASGLAGSAVVPSGTASADAAG